MILHIVNKSPADNTALQLCLRAMGSSDSLILIEDGVYALALPASAHSLPAAQKLFALQEDCAARGLTPDSSKATTVNYTDFVKLVTQHEKTLSWL